MTLGELLVEQDSLAKVNQLGWFGTPSRRMPLAFVALGIFLIVVHNGS